MDVNGNLKVSGQLLNLKPEVLGSDPTGGELGSTPRIWVRAGILRFFNGTSTEQIRQGVTSGELTTALAPYAQSADVTTEISTALADYTNTTGMNSAISAAVADLVSTSELTTALTPYATTTAVQNSIDNALAGLDFQEDVLGLESDYTNVAGRYIYVDGVAFTSGVAAAAGDIVEVNGSGVITALVYDVSVQGPGALTWNRDTSTWYRWNGTNWAEFGGLASVTAGNGIEKTGDTISVKAGDASIIVDGTGVKVGDLSATYVTPAAQTTAINAAVAGLATDASVTAVNDRISDSYFRYTAGAAATTHNVAHNLANQFPIVQVIDVATNKLIVPGDVEFVDANNLTVTLGVSAEVIVNVSWAAA